MNQDKQLKIERKYNIRTGLLGLLYLAGIAGSIYLAKDVGDRIEMPEAPPAFVQFEELRDRADALEDQRMNLYFHQYATKQWEPEITRAIDEVENELDAKQDSLETLASNYEIIGYTSALRTAKDVRDIARTGTGLAGALTTTLLCPYGLYLIDRARKRDYESVCSNENISD